MVGLGTVAFFVLGVGVDGGVGCTCPAPKEEEPPRSGAAGTAAGTIEDGTALRFGCCSTQLSKGRVFAIRAFRGFAIGFRGFAIAPVAGGASP